MSSRKEEQRIVEENSIDENTEDQEIKERTKVIYAINIKDGRQYLNMFIRKKVFDLHMPMYL